MDTPTGHMHGPQRVDGYANMIYGQKSLIEGYTNSIYGEMTMTDRQIN